MDLLIKLSQIYIPLIITIFGIYKIWYKQHTEKERKNEERLEKLVNSVIITNDSMKDMYIELNLKNEQLIRSVTQLLNSFNKINSQVIVTNNNAAEIIKDAIFNKQKGEWITLMYNIYIENGLDKTERTIKKIETATIDLLHKTDQKLRVIEGMENYLIDFNKFIEDVRETKIFYTVLELMKECKIHNDVSKFKHELAATYNINMQKLAEKYTF